MTTDTLKAAKRLLRKEMAELLSKVPAEEIQRQTDEVTQKVCFHVLNFHSYQGDYYKQTHF